MSLEQCSAAAVCSVAGGVHSQALHENSSLAWQVTCTPGLVMLRDWLFLLPSAEEKGKECFHTEEQNYADECLA